MRSLHLVSVVAVGVFSTAVAAAQPDLVITDYTATPVDRGVNYSVTVCNVGDAAPAVGPVVTQYLRTTTEPVCNAPTPFGVAFPKLAPSACYTDTGTKDTNVPVGPGTSWAMADQLCSISENDETNNTKAATYTIAPPDLYVKSITVTPEGFPNPALQHVRIATEICNAGTSAIVGHHAAIITHSPTQPADCTDYGQQTGGTTKLLAGQCYTASRIEYVGAAASAIPPGTYTSWIIADTTCLTADQSRANNTKSLTWNVTGDGTVTTEPGGVADGGLDSGGSTLDGGSSVDAGVCSDGGACMCRVAKTLSVAQSISAGFDSEVECGVIGKSFKVGAGVSGTVTGELTGCPDCKVSLTAEGKVSSTVNLCGDVTFGVEGAASYGYDEQHCTTCDPTTCELSCDAAKYCGVKKISGSGKITASKFYGLQFAKGKTVKIAAKCGATVTGGIAAKAAYEETTDGGCQPCTQCEKGSVEIIGSLAGEGGCYGTVRVGKLSKRLGCTKCMTLGVEVTGGTSEQEGACGKQGCKYAKINVKAGLQTPPLCGGLGWFKAAAQCQAEASGEGVADSCAGRSFKPAAKFSCIVRSGREARLLCEEKK